jgi:hypothetical protein
VHHFDVADSYFGAQTALQQRLEAARQTEQGTPPRVREAEARLRAERARTEALLEDNAALLLRAQQLQQAAALQDSPQPPPAVSPHSHPMPACQFFSRNPDDLVGQLFGIVCSQLQQLNKVWALFNISLLL